MNIINARTIKSLFIKSSSVDYLQKTFRDLSITARQALLERNYDSLESKANQFLEISPATEQYGLVYKAAIISKNGQGDLNASVKLFNELAESHRPKIRAASLLAIGIIELRQKNHHAALANITQASKIAATCAAPLTQIMAQNAFSAFLAENGDTARSLEVLHRIAPTVKQYSCVYPVLQGELYNNLACGYLELGEAEKAFYYSNLAIANPCALNFPEWFDTLMSIKNTIRQAESFSITVPARKADVLPFPPKMTGQQIKKLPVFAGITHIGNCSANQIELVKNFIAELNSERPLEICDKETLQK